MKIRIAIVGYGRMGRAVEQEALARGHEIVATIGPQNSAEISQLDPSNTDCVIEFTQPEVALRNYRNLLDQNLKVVTGTTGWYENRAEVEGWVGQGGGHSFLYASNFSIGVNIFFEMNRKLAAIMNRYDNYDPYVLESHHRNKQDAPSGTAVSTADQIVEGLDRKTVWVTDELQNRAPEDHELSVGSVRAGAIFGTHEVAYHSEIDEIKLSHQAFSRRGFALGAVVAAEWIQGKTGFFDFREVFAGGQ